MKRVRVRGGDESGTTLLLILVFLSSIGMLAGALATYQVAVSRQSFATRRVQAREMGTNTGLEWAVNSLRQGQDGFCQGGYGREVMSLAGREVEVSCRPADTADAGRNSLALFLNRADPEDLNLIRTKGEVGSDSQANLVGPVYNANGQRGWDLGSPLNIRGDVLLADDSGECRSGATTERPKNVVSLYDSAKSCSMDLSSVRPASVPEPCAVRGKCTDLTPRLLDAKGADTKEAPACKVFFPGYYTVAPELAANNYFMPGVYALEFKNEWRIGAAVRGGDPNPANEVSAGDTVMSSVPRCEGVPEPDNPSGVVFVLGRYASLNIGETARVELFSYSQGQQTWPAIVTGGQKEVTEWAAASQLTLDRDLVTVRGTRLEFIAHGGVYAPDSALTMSNGGAAIETIRNTVVVARFELIAESPPKYPGFGIVGRTGTAKKYLMMARSCPGSADVLVSSACSAPPEGPLEQELCSTATVTVFDDDRRTVFIDAWRVDRDPSRDDPANCSLP